MSTQVQVELYWPQGKPRSEILEKNAKKYIFRTPEPSDLDKIIFVLRLLKNQDYAIFQFGDNLYDYLQFTRSEGSLILDFPYSRRFGLRYLQVDRVGIILRDHGFSSTLAFWPSLINGELYMLSADTSSENLVQLNAYFGYHHERFAAEITLEIAGVIFRALPTRSMQIAVGNFGD